VAAIAPAGQSDPRAPAGRARLRRWRSPFRGFLQFLERRQRLELGRVRELVADGCATALAWCAAWIGPDAPSAAPGGGAPQPAPP
jgi:hypothetical protein